MFEEYEKLQRDAVALWKEKASYDFKTLVTSLEFTSATYSRLNLKKNYPRLGYYDRLVDFASNVTPIKKITKEKPKKGYYMEYLFVGDELRLVKYVENERANLLIYIDGGEIFELYSSYDLGCIWKIDGNKQLHISSRGIFVRQIEKLDEVRYRSVNCDLFSYIESIYELRGGTFYETEVLNRVLKNKEDIINFNNEMGNPQPFPNAMIEWGYESLADAGFTKL